MKYILITAMLLAALNLRAQTCSCEKEFLHVKSIVESSFAGFPDKVKALTEAGYKKKVDQFLQLTHNKFSSDNCILIISQYLELFKSNHLWYWSSFDRLKIDTPFVNERPLFEITDKDLTRLKKSRSWEGIYYFRHDSSIKIAVIKDPTPLHDYVGVALESKLPTWKRGMVKIEGKLVNDSVIKGLYYMRNHRPEEQSMSLNNNHNMIGGDWQREGTPPLTPVKQSTGYKPSPVIDARSLSPNTFYIKLGSFGPAAKRPIDSILKANEQLLNTIPNLILDVRENGGGGDAAWEPFIPYFYTNPIRQIGADALVSPTTIAICKKHLENKKLTQAEIDYYNWEIALQERGKGQWVTSNNDQVIDTFTAKAFPKKVIIIVDRWCGSAGDELLLTARQSTKVTLVGENSMGNLDYSNVITTPFSCYPYTLTYATTRSRRLDIGQGIDNIGVAPKIYLAQDKDWIEEALKIAEQP